MEGLLEICFNNTYGSICHDLWNDPDAQVACKQLGFNTTGANVLNSAFYGSSSGPIFLDNVQCDGTEDRLVNCSHQREISDCTHNDDAGIRCLGMYCTANYFVL